MAEVHKMDKKPTIKYTDLNIPTKLFFDILNSGLYSLLGSGTDQELKEAFMVIYDEYVEIGGNPKIKKRESDMLKKNYILTIESRAKLLLYTLMYTPMNKEERDLCIDFINEIPKLNAKIDKNKDLLDECIRVNTKCLGSIRNEIKLLGIEDHKEPEKESVKYIFQQDLARISISLGFQIASKLTMYEFITYRNSAIEKNKPTTKA